MATERVLCSAQKTKDNANNTNVNTDACKKSFTYGMFTDAKKLV